MPFDETSAPVTDPDGVIDIGLLHLVNGRETAPIQTPKDQEKTELKADLGEAALGQTMTPAHAEAETGHEIARFAVRINKDKLNDVVLPPHINSAEKVEELNAVLERISRLPEELNFQPGVTLIVGENGSGKSTLAKALRFAAEYGQVLQRSGKEFDSTYAFDTIFKSRGRGSEEIAMSGLGGPVAQCLLDQIDLRNTGHIRYVDIGVLYGRAMENSRETSRDQYSETYNPNGSSAGFSKRAGKLSEGQGSGRQTVDRALTDYRDMRQERNIRTPDVEGGKGTIEFLDEPETGLSPRRHKNLEAEIKVIFGSAEDGNIIIVPTNSPILFGTDLPRIDLDYPERGVHRPSEYPDDDELAASPAEDYYKPRPRRQQVHEQQSSKSSNNLPSESPTSAEPSSQPQEPLASRPALVETSLSAIDPEYRRQVNEIPTTTYFGPRQGF